MEITLGAEADEATEEATDDAPDDALDDCTQCLILPFKKQLHCHGPVLLLISSKFKIFHNLISSFRPICRSWGRGAEVFADERGDQLWAGSSYGAAILRHREPSPGQRRDQRAVEEEQEHVEGGRVIAPGIQAHGEDRWAVFVDHQEFLPQGSLAGACNIIQYNISPRQICIPTWEMVSQRFYHFQTAIYM